MATPDSSKPDSQAAIQKYSATTQDGAEKDAATIKRIETAIQNSPMGWLQAQFGEASAKASSERKQADSKVAEHKDLQNENSKDAPPDAGTPPKLAPAKTPAVSTPSSAGQAGKTAAPAPLPKASSPKVPKSASIDHGEPKNGGPNTASVADIAQVMSGAGSDAELDQMLNAYEPKGAQSKEMLSRIKQMRGIAEGFDGKLDVYVAQGGAVENAIAKAASWLRVGSDAKAVWAANPYRKMHGFLGSLMTGVSALKHLTSLVGSICGKIGLVLTVVGLLAMIFPPIGVAISAVARVLNAVGLICDAIAFVLSGVLMGLNGVMLAKQISEGATAEEKAATADLMVKEANSAAGSFINMGLMFGPKFMKGLTANSRGVISSMMRRAKTIVGNMSLRLTGNVKNLANRMVRKLGFGGAKMNRAGGQWVAKPNIISRTKDMFNNSRVGKWYQSAPKKIDAYQDRLMKNFGTSKFAKRLDRIGARAGSWADKWDLYKQLGHAGEKAGNFVGNLGANTKVGHRWAHAADAAELESRELAAKFAKADAMHLEQTRWQNFQKERREGQNEKGMPGLSDEKQLEFSQSRAAKVGQQHDDAFLRSERGRNQRSREKRTQDNDFDDLNRDLRNDKGFRDDYLRDLHSSRQKRWSLERNFKNQDAERKQLEAMAKRTADEQARLDKLNHDLSVLDNARAANLKHEAELAKVSGYRQREVHNWADVGDNILNATDPVLQLLHLSSEENMWRKMEKLELRKSMRYNRGSATGNAAGRGGRNIYAKMRDEAWNAQRDDFASFVAKGRQSSNTATTVRGMLSSINRPATTTAVTRPTTSAVTSAPVTTATTTMTAANTTPTPPPTVTPSPSPTPAVSSTSLSAADSTATSTPVASTSVSADSTSSDQAAQPPAVPNASDGDEGGDAIPYWPALIPEFDDAMGDFSYMRKVATEFRKAQIEGKQKAANMLAMYGRYQEYAKLRSEAAKTHQADSSDTQKETQGNVSHAGDSASKASTGASKQEEAKSQSSDRAAVDIPEPESKGFWNRIFSAIKRWVRNKAAQLFGWIQEKVASVVLKGLCGVSMADMRDYAMALKNQQQRAQGVAGTAIQTSGQAEQQQIKLSSDAAKEAQGAADSMGECDRNIGEADAFMADITSFESQLAAEKAHAAAFIGQVHAAVHAEQERRKQEAAQQQPQAPDQQAALDRAPVVNFDDEPGPDGTQTTADEADADDGDQDDDGVPDAAEAEATKSSIVAAAGYVADTADRLKHQIDGRANDYQVELALALTNRSGKDEKGSDLVGPAKKHSKNIVETFEEFADVTRNQMAGFRDRAIDPSNAAQFADQIIAAATKVDETFEGSMEALDELYARTYQGVRSGGKNFKTVLYGDGGWLGDPNDAMGDIQEVAYDNATSTMTAAWDTIAAPITEQRMPDPKQTMTASTGPDPAVATDKTA